jgi:membrane protease YdiL (CAAX protease family)
MTAARPPEQATFASEGLFARYPLISFFVMAYALSWIAWSPWYLSEDGVGLLPYFPSPGVSQLILVAGLLLGPFLSGFIMTGATEGRAGIRRFLRRIVLWRVGFQWYLFVLVGIPLIMLLGAIVVPGVLASFEPIDPLSTLINYVPFFILVIFIGGPLFEEPGWRGYALPRVQQLHGPLVGTLILGVLWALWHLPQFFTKTWDTPKGSVLDIVWFVIVATALGILYTWVFNNTRGSVLLVILAHASTNVFGAAILYQILPTPVLTESLISLVIGFGVAAVLIVALTRGRLGYQNYQQDEEPDTAAASA